MNHTITIHNLFKNFRGREQDLRRIKRYSLYPVMFYRSSLWTHAKRVFWLTREIIPFAEKAYGSSFDSHKAELMALVHDDHEIVLGDIQAANKSKMTSQQLAELDINEVNAIQKIASRFPKKIDDYNYQELLLSHLRTDCLESLVANYADKLDGFSEAWHEIYAGNTNFTTNETNKYGRVPTPPQLYIPPLSDFSNKHPQIAELFKQPWPLFKKPEVIDYKSIVKKGRPHTKSSIKQNSGYPYYDIWKQIILKYADPEEIENLYQQIELL